MNAAKKTADFFNKTKNKKIILQHLISKHNRYSFFRNLHFVHLFVVDDLSLDWYSKRVWSKYSLKFLKYNIFKFLLSFYSAILFRWYIFDTKLISCAMDSWCNKTCVLALMVGLTKSWTRERERGIQSVQPRIFSSDFGSGSIISNSPWRRSWEKRRKEDYSITYGNNKIFVRILPRTYSSLSNVMLSLFDMRNVSRREEQSCQAVQFEWLLWLIWSRLSVQLPVDGKTHQI